MRPMDCVSTGSDNGLSPVRYQAITWTNADLSSIGLQGTNFSEVRIKIQNFSFMKMRLKMSVKLLLFCPGGGGGGVNSQALDDAVGNLVSTGSDNDDTKLVYKPMFTGHQWSPRAFIFGEFLIKYSR